MEMGKIIGKSLRSEHFGIVQFWEFFWQPFGKKYIFEKTQPKQKMESFRKYQVLSNPITARSVFVHVLHIADV